MSTDYDQFKETYDVYVSCLDCDYEETLYDRSDLIDKVCPECGSKQVSISYSETLKSQYL